MGSRNNIVGGTNQHIKNGENSNVSSVPNTQNNVSTNKYETSNSEFSGGATTNNGLVCRKCRIIHSRDNMCRDTHGQICLRTQNQSVSVSNNTYNINSQYNIGSSEGSQMSFCNDQPQSSQFNEISLSDITSAAQFKKHNEWNHMKNNLEELGGTSHDRYTGDSGEVSRVVSGSYNDSNILGSSNTGSSSRIHSQGTAIGGYVGRKEEVCVCGGKDKVRAHRHKLISEGVDGLVDRIDNDKGDENKNNIERNEKRIELDLSDKERRSNKKLRRKKQKKIICREDEDGYRKLW